MGSEISSMSHVSSGGIQSSSNFNSGGGFQSSSHVQWSGPRIDEDIPAVFCNPCLRRHRTTYWSPNVKTFINPPFFLSEIWAALWINIHLLLLIFIFPVGTLIGHLIIHKDSAHTAHTCFITALIGAAVFIPSFWIVFRTVKGCLTCNWRFIGDTEIWYLVHFMLLRTLVLAVPFSVVITVLGTVILRRAHHAETIGTLAKAAKVGALGGAFTIMFSSALIVVTFLCVYYGMMYLIYEPSLYMQRHPEGATRV
ncbi:hypothetical protein CYLTODRAFT_458203 [Cylindrobasidium torrendii FP15055 ss-10]|uniref:Uncharacterized protein n=1 Tax=Cylindrobasidium torrendii FP15055 ss-10 TaxID=1314674 RepID=A0A0D7AYP1_9AGAR|nr:hypothetical protein CYLTODRAFT_458203 [Cylindrobasidium torrendii FP15055 ss-10]